MRKIMTVLAIALITVSIADAGVSRQRRKIKKDDPVLMQTVERPFIVVSNNLGGVQGTKATGPVCEKILAKTAEEKPVMTEVQSGVFVETSPQQGRFEQYHLWNGLLDNQTPTAMNLEVDPNEGWEYCAYYCGDNPPMDAEEARNECIWRSVDEKVFDPQTQTYQRLQLTLMPFDVSWWLRNSHGGRANTHAVGMSWIDGYREITCVTPLRLDAHPGSALVRNRIRADWSIEVKSTKFIPGECTWKNIVRTP